jgi:peptidoglycan/xylan/chitin deacetylase (PgdA/CDA1 family)
MNPTLRERVKTLIPRALVTRDLGGSAGTQPRLLLTFDDGPDPLVTPQVLERLDAFHARAVFFVVGRRADAAPELVRQIRDRGHRIGNHTYSHPNDGDPPFRTYLADVRRCQDVVRRCTNTTPELFRPPKGHLSLTSLTVPKVVGLRTINWSLNVRDWACRTAEQAVDAGRQLETRAASGQIVLLHDDNIFVLDLLDYVLPRLRARGFDLRSALDRF